MTPQDDRLMYGIAMRGGPRVDPTNYPGISHDELHEMVNNDIDPGMVDKVGAAWNTLGGALHRIGGRLTTASASTEQAWSGHAAEGARKFNSGVANWSGNTAQGAQLTSDNMATQSAAAGTVKSAVPPPMEYDIWDEINDLLTASDPATGMNTVRAKLARKRALHEVAADAVAVYDQTLIDTSSTMPAFETPPAFDPNAHDPIGGPGGGGNAPAPSHPAPGGGGSRSGGVNPPPTGGPEGAPRVANPSDVLVLPARSAATDPSTAGLGLSGRGGMGSTGAGGPGGTGSNNGRGSAEPGFGTPMGTWGGLSGAGGGAGKRGGFGWSGGGSGGARGGVEGRVPGPGAGALAAEQAALGRGATGGGAGARGAAGMGGTPMGGGGSGRGGEDEERERPSYLLEDDPDALFGTNEAASPSVIE